MQSARKPVLKANEKCEESERTFLRFSRSAYRARCNKRFVFLTMQPKITASLQTAYAFFFLYLLHDCHTP
jgi:hypothetical protein